MLMYVYTYQLTLYKILLYYITFYSVLLYSDYSPFEHLLHISMFANMYSCIFNWIEGYVFSNTWTPSKIRNDIENQIQHILLDSRAVRPHAMPLVLIVDDCG